MMGIEKKVFVAFTAYCATWSRKLKDKKKISQGHYSSWSSFLKTEWGDLAINVLRWLKCNLLIIGAEMWSNKTKFDFNSIISLPYSQRSASLSYLLLKRLKVLLLSSSLSGVLHSTLASNQNAYNAFIISFPHQRSPLVPLLLEESELMD